MQNLYYFRSIHGNRLLFATCEIARIEIVREGAVVYTYAGCPYPVVSRWAENVIKEPPRRTGPDAGYQFNRYEKLVEP
jgi:hypothetical protein